MSRLLPLGVLILTVTFTDTPAVPETLLQRGPNIVLIVADDQGWTGTSVATMPTRNLAYDPAKDPRRSRLATLSERANPRL